MPLERPEASGVIRSCEEGDSQQDEHGAHHERTRERVTPECDGDPHTQLAQLQRELASLGGPPDADTAAGNWWETWQGVAEGRGDGAGSSEDSCRTYASQEGKKVECTETSATSVAPGCVSGPAPWPLGEFPEDLRLPDHDVAVAHTSGGLEPMTNRGEGNDTVGNEVSEKSLRVEVLKVSTVHKEKDVGGTEHTRRTLKGNAMLCEKTNFPSRKRHL